MRRPVLSLLAICTVGALALAGCSKDGAQSGGGAAAEPEQGPLEKYLSAMWDGQDWTQERYDEENKKREELIAQCMSKEGFEYTPNTENTGVVYSSDGSDGPQWGTLEFAKQYGYGLVSWPGYEDMQQQQEDIPVDPNQAYVDALSESEAQAYYTTLYGPQPTEEELAAQQNGEATPYDWTTNGCWGWADHELNADSVTGAYEDPEFADLFASMQSMYEEIYTNNPDMAALDKQWAACMADAGYPDLTVRNEAQNTLMDEYNALQTNDKGEYVEASKEKLDAFRQKEIDQAVADWTCADKIKYDETMRKIDFAAQEKFVEDHKDELDAMLAKYAQQSS